MDKGLSTEFSTLGSFFVVVDSHDCYVLSIIVLMAWTQLCSEDSIYTNLCICCHLMLIGDGMFIFYTLLMIGLFFQ